MLRVRVITLLAAVDAALALTTGAAAAAAPALEASASEPGLSAVPGDVDDLTFDSFDADYVLTRADDRTSRLRVVETIVAVFPDSDQNRGIRRSMPDTYNGQPLEPVLVSITDENGAPRPADVEDVDDEFSVVSRADDYLHGRQTYVITYTLENVTWDFPDTGLEFYWNVNGTRWGEPFGRVTARLHLDADLAPSLTGNQACYRGEYGLTDACDDISRAPSGDGGATITATAAGVAPYETLTFAVGFAPGTFAMYDTSLLASPAGWLQVLALVGTFAAGAFGFRAWWKASAGGRGRRTIVAQYEPPASLDALESAVLIRRRKKGITAEVLEQAVAGSIRIVESTKKTWRGKPQLVAELVDFSLADENARPLLTGIFHGRKPGSRYTFGVRNQGAARAAQRALNSAESEILTRGLRRKIPTAARAWPIAVASVMVVAVWFFGIGAIADHANWVAPVILMAVSVVALVAILVLLALRPLTARGARFRDHLRGMEQFIAWAEADRIRMLQSPEGAERVAIDVDDPRQKLAVYERLLPYAVIFGQEKQWARELTALYPGAGEREPHWYAGSGPLDATVLAAGLRSLTIAAPYESSGSGSSGSFGSSSSSGGSSGGGFAGGGGGGGGGGGV